MRGSKAESGGGRTVQASVCTTYERSIIAIDEVHMDIIRDREASERAEHAESGETGLVLLLQRPTDRPDPRATGLLHVHPEPDP